jgi:hypothetical protein
MKNEMLYSDSDEPPERSSVIVDLKPVTRSITSLPPLHSCIPPAYQPNPAVEAQSLRSANTRMYFAALLPRRDCIGVE